MAALVQQIFDWPYQRPKTFLVLVALVWLSLYQLLIPVSETLVAGLPVERDSHLGGALQFFFYDAPKVLMLLTAVVFVMGMLNSYFTPERTRALLAGRMAGTANVMAAGLGGSYSLLFLLCSATLYWFCTGGRSTGRYVFLPDLRANGQ